MDELVIKAAQNNADWCDIVCRTHDVPGEFLESIWINQQEIPTLLYPNAVITKPLSDKTFNEVIQTLKKIPLETYAIKDSFNELPVDKMACKILFEAEWITYPNEVIHESTIEGWTIIKDEEELKNWEYAWNNNQPSDKRIFLQSILSVKDIFFLAKQDNGRIVAGGIVNISLDEFVDLLNSLFSGKSYEEKTVAGILLGYFPKLRKQINPQLVDKWLDDLQGWAEVDTLCQSNFTADEFLEKWNTWDKLIRKFSEDKNVSKKRASLVLLTGVVTKSDDKRLSDLAFDVIDKLKNEKDILITKAISWLLRDLIHNNKDQVRKYLEENKNVLPKIVVREVSNKLTKGKKN